jgi:hypothetical protein
MSVRAFFTLSQLAPLRDIHVPLTPSTFHLTVYLLNHTSRLEALPAELFDRVLSYVYDPEQCEVRESDTNFRGYRFEISLLRVNKTIHELANSYLHYKLP